MTYKNQIWEKRQDRIAYLQDKVTQMGHDPQKYEQWHKELEALKGQIKREEWPGAWGDKTTKEQWTKIERAIGNKLNYCSDAQLHHGLQSLQREIKRRKKAKEKATQTRNEEQAKKLVAQGYMRLSEAIKYVQKAMHDHKILTDLWDEKVFATKRIRHMIHGHDAYRKMGPMRQGILCLSDATEQIFVKPKYLLCFVINRLQWENSLIKRNELGRVAIRQAAAGRSLAEVQKEYSQKLQAIEAQKVKVLGLDEEGEGPRFVPIDQVTDEMKRQAARNARGSTR